LPDRAQAFRLAIAHRYSSAPRCSISIQPLVVRVEPISRVDCHEDSGESTKLADRKAAVRSLVYSPLALRPTDRTNSLSFDSVGLCCRSRFILCNPASKRLGNSSRVDRTPMPYVNLDNSLRSRDRILHVRSAGCAVNIRAGPSF